MHNHKPDSGQSYAEQIKGKTGLQRIINACGYSMDGFKQRLGEVVAEKGPRRLLLRVDKQASSQALVTFTAAALAAGCDVQIAAEAAAGGS